MKLGKKATVAFYLSFIIISILIITMSAVLAPLGVLFNTKMYLAGQDILKQANSSIESIQDAGMRQAIANVTTAAYMAAETNIEVNNSIYQYGWVLVIALAGLTLFLITRETVEFSRGGFV